MTATPSLFTLFLVWCSLGFQSFGGGSATRFLIWQATVDQHHWISDEEFTRFWAMTQLSPGINLLGLTALIGWRLAGLSGVFVTLFGLLLPSVSMTMLITALYAYIRESPIVQSALRGIVPATVGLGLVMTWRMFEPIWRESSVDKMVGKVVTLVLLGVTILLMVSHSLPIFIILIGVGVVSGLVQWLLHRYKTAPAIATDLPKPPTP